MKWFFLLILDNSSQNRDPRLAKKTKTTEKPILNTFPLELGEEPPKKKIKLQNWILKKYPIIVPPISNESLDPIISELITENKKINPTPETELSPIVEHIETIESADREVLEVLTNYTPVIELPTIVEPIESEERDVLEILTLPPISAPHANNG